MSDVPTTPTADNGPADESPLARYGVTDPYDHPAWPLAKRLIAVAADCDPESIDESDGSHEQVNGLLAQHEWLTEVTIADVMGLVGDWGTDDVNDAVVSALHEYRGLRAERDRQVAEGQTEHEIIFLRGDISRLARECDQARADRDRLAAELNRECEDFAEVVCERDRLRAEVERLQAGQGKPQRGRPIPPCHPRGDGCDVGSHYLTVRHPDGSMGWTVHISDREIRHLRWLTGPEELRAYSDVAQRSLGSAPGEWTVSPPQDASVSAPQIIRAVPVSDQPEPPGVDWRAAYEKTVGPAARLEYALKALHRLYWSVKHLDPSTHHGLGPALADAVTVLETSEANEDVAIVRPLEHVHTWKRCAECPTSGLCPWAGGICCPAELAEIPDRPKVCALCGHQITLERCGSASNIEGEPLCHHDTHSCYHRWTVYGERPDRPDTQSAPPEGLVYRIAREVSGIQNWDQVRDFQAAHCAQVRKTIEVYRRLLAEAGPAAEQPVQPAPGRERDRVNFSKINADSFYAAQQYVERGGQSWDPDDARVYINAYLAAEAADPEREDET